MTFREKLQQEHPEEVSEFWTGGCHNCPYSYGYEVEPIGEHCENIKCRDCWDREIPTEQPTGKTYEDGLQDALELAKKINVVTVRWFDGYMEVFNATEVRFGNAYLWMRLEDGNNRHIPLSQVRWFGTSIESHQKTGM